MNVLITLTLLCLVSVGQVFSQIQPSAGATSLVGAVVGGASDASPGPTRWIEFMDMDNHWSKLGNTFTVEAWVWHSNMGTSNWQPILTRHPGMNAPRTDAHFSIAIKDKAYIEVHAGCGCDENGANCGNGYSLVSGVENFVPETWQHIAVTFDGDGLSETSQTAQLYINGVVVDSTTWSAQDPQCAGRMSNWAKYADVTVGYYDDEAEDQANVENPNMVFGWWGRIDEIRFWSAVRTTKQIQGYHDVGLKGSEYNLLAYYQFSPSQEVLDDTEAAKQITNEVGDYLHGLPQPDPTDGQIFMQVGGLRIDSFSHVYGQSDQDEDLPPIPNAAEFESYPGTTEIYSVVPGSYSVALQGLVDEGIAQIYGNPDDLTSVTVFVTCVGNDCSNYEENWKDFYFEYTATYENPSPVARLYLRIETGCPSGVFDECGTCEGDNSLCQCVVYHGFESERMSYILFQWSLNNLIEEVTATIATLESTMDVLDMETVTNAALRQQIYDLMNFYNNDLTDYCGDLTSFVAELESSIPKTPEALINSGANSQVDGTMPFIPSFIPPF